MAETRVLRWDDEVTRALKILGIRPEFLKEVNITPERVVVSHFVTDGRKMLVDAHGNVRVDMAVKVIVHPER